MRFQDYAIQITQRAVEDLFVAARRVPADKVQWKPLDAGRSTLDIVQECAQTPLIAIPILETRQMPPFSHEILKAAQERRAQWTTLDECERICGENSLKLYEAINEFPDDDLVHTIILPFGGGLVRSMADISLLHYWNTIYHYGQINYIQTLLGDFNMH